MAVGAVIVGYLAKSKFDDAKLLCGDDLQCDTEAERATGQELVDSARFRGNVSTVIAGAAVAALGTGLVLWLVERRGATEPKRSGDEPAAFRVVPFLTSSAVGVAIGGVL